MKKQLRQIRDAADKLLAHLGIENSDEASDGPGIPEVFDALVAARDNASEDDIAKATAGIAWLMDFFDAICCKITLINLEKLVELWVEFYAKLDDLARNRLRLTPIYFLTPRV